MLFYRIHIDISLLGYVRVWVFLAEHAPVKEIRINKSQDCKTTLINQSFHFFFFFVLFVLNEHAFILFSDQSILNRASHQAETWINHLRELIITQKKTLSKEVEVGADLA